jgi:CDP-diacylglycerol---glycerol-3-phosphate 3-phosphatidyltransferase
MPSIYDLKPKFQNLLRPLTTRLAAVGVTANQVTISAMVLSFVTGVAVWRFPSPRALLLLPAVLFVRMALNAIDGMLAREHNQKSRLGAILNELGDVFSDAALYLPLAALSAFNARLIVLIVILAVISEMTGVVGIQIGASRRYDGPFGKSDRAFGFGALALLLGLGIPLTSVLEPILWIMLVLIVLTILNRARGALNEARAKLS